MNILMLGAGGVGGYLAAKLIPAGHSVSLLARGPHLDAIRAGGLTLVEDGATSVVRPTAASDSESTVLNRYFSEILDNVLCNDVPISHLCNLNTLSKK